MPTPKSGAQTVRQSPIVGIAISRTNARFERPWVTKSFNFQQSSAWLDLFPAVRTRWSNHNTGTFFRFVAIHIYTLLFGFLELVSVLIGRQLKFCLEDRWHMQDLLC
jgi:hypothetical protein